MLGRDFDVLDGAAASRFLRAHVSPRVMRRIFADELDRLNTYAASAAAAERHAEALLYSVSDGVATITLTGRSG